MRPGYQGTWAHTGRGAEALPHIRVTCCMPFLTCILRTPYILIFPSRVGPSNAGMVRSRTSRAVSILSMRDGPKSYESRRVKPIDTGTAQNGKSCQVDVPLAGVPTCGPNHSPDNGYGSASIMQSGGSAISASCCGGLVVFEVTVTLGRQAKSGDTGAVQVVLMVVGLCVTTMVVRKA